MIDCANKTIVVTGALGQLGRAATELLLKQGATVIAVDIVEASPGSEQAIWLVEHASDRLVYWQYNVSEEPEVASLAERVQQDYGQLHGYLHAAFSCVSKQIHEYELDEWNSVLQGCLTSAFLLCKHFVQLMIASGGGSIVNVSSTLAEHPSMHNSAYVAAKAGVSQFTRAIALDYAQQGIRANAILPGFFTSSHRLGQINEATTQLYRQYCLLERTGVAEEVAAMAVFLLSDASSYMTGSLLPVDGGYMMKSY